LNDTDFVFFAILMLLPERFDSQFFHEHIVNIV